MPKINWKDIWKTALDNKALFPIKDKNNKTISVYSPTRFSKVGKFSIDITPTFNDDNISFELLLFNDNIGIEDLDKSNLIKDDFNSISNELSKVVLNNKLLERFSIQSDEVKDDKSAVEVLVEYINSIATESGRMFDDKLDEINSVLKNNASESYMRTLNNIRKNRKNIFKKVESILSKHYKWKMPKNEDTSDSVASFYDKNGNLVAVVSLLDNELIIDLSKDITSKISILKSDEEIESEITSDIDAAHEIAADQEIEHLKDIVAVNKDTSFDDIQYNVDESRCLKRLSNRLSKLESLYIKHRLY